MTGRAWFKNPDGSLTEISGGFARLDMTFDAQAVLYGSVYTRAPRVAVEAELTMNEAGVTFCTELMKRYPMADRVLTCDQCVETFPAQEDVMTFDPCPECGSDSTRAGTETPCPRDGDDCADDNHHWGRGTHVVDDPT